jgi:phosphoglycolate phosphatase
LTQLRAAGCRLGVCTNKPIGPTRAVLAAFGMDALIEAVIGGDSLPQRKPEAEPLLNVIRTLGGTPASAVLIGDSAVDIACAEAAGVPSIIIPSGYGIAPPQAKITVAGFAELPSVIDAL